MTLEHDKRRRRLALAAGLTMVAITAIQFVAARFSLREHLTATDIASLRFAGAGLVFAPIIWRTGLAKMQALGWRRASVLAVLIGFPYTLIINSGLAYTSASDAAALCPASIVLFSFLLSRIVFKDAIPRVRIVGILAIIGGLLLFVSPARSKPDDVLFGDMLFTGSGIMFSTMPFWCGDGPSIRSPRQRLWCFCPACRSHSSISSRQAASGLRRPSRSAVKW